MVAFLEFCDLYGKEGMDLYQKISRKIIAGNLSSLTLDIFDTILLRKIWPEDLQFLKVAQIWCPLFCKIFSKNITAEEIYSFRLYARNELISINRKYNTKKEAGDFTLKSQFEYDVNLTTWFSQIIELFVIKYQIQLEEEHKQKLLNFMVESELTTEKEHLIPNYELIGILKSLKKKYPQLKMFYVSDMYLESKDINEIFRFFKINIFDGGITSTEAGYTKATGKMYHYLHESKILDKDFDIARNLHIGDNKIVDVKNAVLAGSNAILYRKFRFRSLRTFVGKIQAKYIKDKIAREDTLLLSNIDRNSDSPAVIWRSYGALFAQPLFVFLEHLLLSAQQAKQTTFLMVSSEANVFKKYGNLLTSDFSKQLNIIAADKLNRRLMIRAYIWALIKDQDFKFNAEPIMKTVNLGEVDGSRRDFYDFVFGREYPYSEATINYRSDKDFFKAFLEEVSKADPEYLKPLKEAYMYAKSFLPKQKTAKIVIVDAGWGGTVQVLFHEFASLHGYRTEIDGLYIGVMPGNRFEIRDIPPMEGYLMPDVGYGKDRSLFCAALWEYPYTSKPQFCGDISRLEQIHVGLEKGLELFRSTKNAPKIYYDKTVRIKIKRLVSRPTQLEAKTIGSIEFDVGFAKPASYRIVDMNYTRGWVVRQLLRHPRRTVKNIVFARNHWAGGFIKYYKIPSIYYLVKIYGKIVKKTLI